MFSNDLEASWGGPEHTPWSLSAFISAPGAAVGSEGNSAVGAASSGRGHSSASLNASVVDMGNGTALCEYTPRIAGRALLSVLLASGSAPPAHISGSPFEVSFCSN